MAPGPRTLKPHKLSGRGARFRDFRFCLLAVLPSVLLVAVPAHAQLGAAALESLLRGNPQCEDLRRAVITDMGVGRLSSRCERAIDNACEAMSDGRLADPVELANACPSGRGDSAAERGRRCTWYGGGEYTGRSRGVFWLGHVAKHAGSRNVAGLIEDYERVENVCMGTAYSLMARAAARGNLELVEYFARQGVPSQIAVVKWPQDESVTDLFERLRPDATRQFPLEWNLKGESGADLADPGDFTHLFEYSATRGRLDILEAATMRQGAALRAGGGRYFLAAARSRKRDRFGWKPLSEPGRRGSLWSTFGPEVRSPAAILLFLWKEGAAPSADAVTPRDRVATLQALAMNPPNADYQDEDKLIDMYYSPEEATNALLGYGNRSGDTLGQRYAELAWLALENGRLRLVERLVEDGFPVDGFGYRMSLRSAIIDAGWNRFFPSGGVVARSRVLLRYVSQKFLVEGGVIAVPLASAGIFWVLTLIFYLRAGFRKSGRRLRVRHVLLWGGVFVSLLLWVVVVLAAWSEGGFTDLRRDDEALIVTAFSLLVAGAGALAVRRCFRAPVEDAVRA